MATFSSHGSRGYFFTLLTSLHGLGVVGWSAGGVLGASQGVSPTQDPYSKDGTLKTRMCVITSSLSSGNPGYIVEGVSVGNYHSCALGTDSESLMGRVLCWGDNVYGQSFPGSIQQTLQAAHPLLQKCKQVMPSYGETALTLSCTAIRVAGRPVAGPEAAKHAS
eukprot:989856-Pelagomonas_calceolata.AAC.7